MTSIASNFAHFLGKHADELSIIATVLERLWKELPIPRAEKDVLENDIKSLTESVANIKASVKDISSITMPLTDDDRRDIARKLVTEFKDEIIKISREELTTNGEKTSA